MRWKWIVGLIPLVAFAGLRFAPEQAAGQQPPPPPKAPPPPPPPAQPGAQQPAPPPPPALTPIQQLGKTIFFDTRLSSPAGLACASCHAPPAGYTYPNSAQNAQLGVASGAVAGRFGNRKVPTITYSSFSPNGPTFNANAKLYIGGLFWDGRAATLQAQASGPLFNPNEMNNIVHNLASPALVAQTVQTGPYAALFQQVFGANVFSQPAAQVVTFLTQAVAAWESTSEVSPFSSLYDAWSAGQAQFTAQQLAGIQLATGSTSGRPGGPANYKNAQCTTCHVIPSVAGASKDLFTGFAFLNTGVPKNPNNPYYTQTNAQTNPLGFNPLGANYIDYGLGDFLYPANNLPSGNIGAGSNGQGDYLAINGTFKTPTLRNVDKRPNSTFVKAYGHNGFFKSLAQIVHFYNTRNLTTQPGEVINFTLPNPYAGLKGQPLWPPPEYPSPVTLRNPTGAPGQIGNLGLTPQEEASIVAFLTTLTDN